MSHYIYSELRDGLFTDEGQRDLVKVRDAAFAMLSVARVVRMDALMSAARTGDPQRQMALVDRLVEIGDLREVSLVGPVAGQHRIFEATKEIHSNGR
jgi:hypothetical protein